MEGEETAGLALPAAAKPPEAQWGGESGGPGYYGHDYGGKMDDGKGPFCDLRDKRRYGYH